MTVHTKMRHFGQNIMRISSKSYDCFDEPKCAPFLFCKKVRIKITTFLDQNLFCHYLIVLNVHSNMFSSGLKKVQHPSIKEIMIGTIRSAIQSYNVHNNLYKYWKTSVLISYYPNLLFIYFFYHMIFMVFNLVVFLQRHLSSW